MDSFKGKTYNFIEIVQIFDCSLFRDGANRNGNNTLQDVLLEKNNSV